MTDNHSALRCPEHGGIGFVRDCVDPRHTSPVAPEGEPVAEALSALHEAFGLLASHRVARDSELGRKLDEVLYALESRPASPESAASDRERERELVALLSELNRRGLPHQISTCGPDLYCATVGVRGSGAVPFSSAFAALHAATANHDARKGTTP